MNVSWLISLFGHYAAYVGGAFGIVLVTMVVTGFCQGRRVTIGPFSVGPRPRTNTKKGGVARRRDNGAESARSYDPRTGKADKVFQPSQARTFYDAIACNYDERNSGNLIATHMEAIARIEEARDRKPEPRVLDLGGGTGQNIATYFFKDSRMRWTYVDFCPAMVAQLHLHLDGRPLARNLEVHVGDINRIHTSLPAKSYDVVLMSLVLTSMPELPDFHNIAKLLTANGRLIISDINPLYTDSHPLYQATAHDGTIVAMRMKAVQPLQIARRAEAAGMHQSEITEQIGGRDVSYSFITTFVSAPASRSRRTYLSLRGSRTSHG